MICDKNDCKKDARFSVIFELRVTKGGPAAQSTPIMNVCEDHMEVEWKDIYSDDGWKRLCEAFKAIGRMPPVKEFSNIAIIPIGDLPDELKKMYQLILRKAKKDNSKKNKKE